MSALARGAGDHGAMNDWSGTFSANIPYRESYTIMDSATGTAMDLDGLDITITFRKCRDSSADLTLTTTGSTLVVETIENENGVSVESFRPAAVDVSALSGDYFGDIKYTDTDDVQFHLAHGIVTFQDDPV